MSEENSADKPAPSNLYEFQYDFGGGRKLMINGSFYVGQTDEEKHADLTRLVDVIERQRSRFELEMLNQHMKQLGKQVEDQSTTLEELHEKISDRKSLDKEPNLKKHLADITKSKNAVLVSIKEGEIEIGKLQQFIETGVRA